MTREEIETYQRESNQRAGYDPEREGVTVVVWCANQQQDGLMLGHAPAVTADCHPCFNDS